ncbi:MAG: hypothetical protein ACR2JC_08235 [Chloroflexota bacterium]|nr:MAG: hypothetical protein DLM70_13925 [Chloroflexota bacterium]
MIVISLLGAIGGMAPRSMASGNLGDVGIVGPSSAGVRTNPHALAPAVVGNSPRVYDTPHASFAGVSSQQPSVSTQPALVSPALATSVTGTATPFTGSDMMASCSPSYCYKKPDGAVAAGPASVLQAVNQAFAVYDRGGNELLGPVSLQAFFDTSGHPYDERAVYDAGNAVNRGYGGGSGRFILSALVQNSAGTSDILLAVSQNSSPESTATLWCTYSFDGTVQFPSGKGAADFDGLSTDGSNLYVSSNEDTFNGATFLGSRILMIPKIGVYPDATTGACPTASTTSFSSVLNPDGSHAYAVQPANRPDAAHGTTYPMYFVNSIRTSGSSLSVRSIVKNSSGTPLLTPPRWISVAAYSEPYSAPQPGGKNIYPGDASLLGAIYRYGQIYTANSTRKVSGVTGANTYSSVQWYIFSPAQSTAATYYYTDPVTSYYTPQVVVGCQTTAGACSAPYAALEVTGSSSTQAASAYWLVAGQGTPVLFQQGVPGWQYSAAWGDYPGVSVDPSNRTQVWLEGEYAETPTTWGTAMSSICVAC